MERAFGRLRRLRMFPDHFDGSRQALAQLKNITSDLIGRFAWSVENATSDTYGDGPLTRYSANVVIPEETSYEIVALKGIAVYFVMAPREHEPFHQEERQIINDLIDVLMADSPRPSSALEAVLLQDWYDATASACASRSTRWPPSPTAPPLRCIRSCDGRGGLRHG